MAGRELKVKGQGRQERRGLDKARRSKVSRLQGCRSCNWEWDTDGGAPCSVESVCGKAQGALWMRMESPGSVLGRWHQGVTTGIRCLVDRWAPR